ncbi:MAG: phosphoribosylglycinamide formyltransferase [Candidatus Anoxymicrobium japonicum]|uniref:Phosphoribosylglycinamide formyltransferase n=1 Tax=Candidatus Anoxymicrobium japonicum TaxID=2013648 RepID=A0A2N3G6C9_9ACTN|nr:MAG: phosphoribosylglycinamide formyltransferase [Candidatus Anoxymicrobium japonicum]
MMRIGVLASGSGTNLEAIAQAIDDGDVPAEIAVVVSDNPSAFALERARRRGIATKVIELTDFPDRSAFDRAIVEILREAKVDLVVLAGYMKLVGHEIIDAFRDRIMNIHPALLPCFPGERGVVDALEHGVKVTGVTVHFVDEGLDSGPIIAQEAVLVEEGDDLETLHNRIHLSEYRIYPRAIRLFATGRLTVDGRRVKILSSP